MTDTEKSLPTEEALRTLQERAKELDCLYRVDEILSRFDQPDEGLFTEILHAIPPGWQYPDICHATLNVFGQNYRRVGLRETPWIQTAPIRVRKEIFGEISVYYAEERPEADEGPFLAQERKLLDTIADRIGLHLTEWLARGKEEWDSTHNHAEAKNGGRWLPIIEFLKRTDPALLERVTRKMLNHLGWRGVEGAEKLLPRHFPGAEEDSNGESNQPLARVTPEHAKTPTDKVFRIAAANYSEAEILGLVESWINQAKLGALMYTLEQQGSSLADIGEALSRFRKSGLGDLELPESAQAMLRVPLLKRYLTDQIDYINIAKNFVTLEDFHELSQRLIFTRESHGKLGGKGAGVFLARRILEKAALDHELLKDVRVPRTWYITSDAILSFILDNNQEEVYERKYMEIDQVRQQYPHVIQVFKSSSLPPEVVKGLSVALDDLGTKPLIVRSSSLLEDRTGSAFSGKYKSLFLANQGTKKERLSALQDAVAEVYASVFGPDPIEYRSERGLLDVHEEMGVMIQRVVGTTIGKYFLPSFSGVAVSANEFRWSPRIKREDGLVRLVPGLGTRAVDRLSDDYPVLIAPGQPGLRVNATTEEVVRYSPKKIDLINLETRSFETVLVDDFLREHGNDLPMVKRMVSLVDHDGIRRPRGLDIDFSQEEAVVTFEGLVSDTPFVAQMETLLEVLSAQLGTPVDIEFASDGKHFYLLQCRPQSYSRGGGPAPIPRNLPVDQVLFSAHRFVSNGRVPDVTHVVYVDPDGYADLSDLAQLQDVGRAVSRLNQLLPRRQFILMGPGRWGSRGDIRLGVSVTYADINNTSVLIEIARKKEGYVPDLSFGTHFFQDLVEAEIRYLPLYPDEPENAFKEGFFLRSRNLLPDLLPEYAHLEETVRVIDIKEVTNGKILRILMNSELDEAVGVLSSPDLRDQTQATPGEARIWKEVSEAPAEEHWRWRLDMAERIASLLDPDRFGVDGIWVFGSTKNGTAGSGSDIDLIVHFRGEEVQRQSLVDWLEGWSLSLAQMNFLRTGYRSAGLLDVHYITDKDIESRSSYAVKIDAVTDAARPLRLMEKPQAKGPS
ncbi:PEP/pyruvate-binding domain-containing protein [Gemmatimonadota bacterium]